MILHFQHKYVPQLKFADGIAPLIFGVFMILAALIAFLLPETNGVPVPETVADANGLTYNYRY